MGSLTSATHASTSGAALSMTSGRSNSRLRRALLALLFSGALTLGGFGLSSAPAQAWTNGACPTSNGVTVVVDFAGLGGGTTVRCAPGAQSSGVSALRNAGFSVGFVQQNSSQGLFVCRINGKPNPGAESCAITPPVNASWSYWNAKRGGSWQYANAGAGNLTPATGGVEGWRFNNGRPTQPSVAPPVAPPAPKPAPKPTQLPQKKPTSKPTGSSTSNGTGGGKNPSDSSPSAPTKAATASGASGASESPKSSAAASAPPLAVSNNEAAADQQVAAPDSATAATSPGQPQSPAGAIAAIVAVVLIGGGAAFVWARRSGDS